MDGSAIYQKITLRTNELDMAKGHCRVNEWPSTEAVLRGVESFSLIYVNTGQAWLQNVQYIRMCCYALFQLFCSFRSLRLCHLPNVTE